VLAPLPEPVIRSTGVPAVVSPLLPKEEKEEKGEEKGTGTFFM